MHTLFTDSQIDAQKKDYYGFTGPLKQSVNMPPYLTPLTPHKVILMW